MKAFVVVLTVICNVVAEFKGDTVHWIWTCNLNEERCEKSAASPVGAEGSSVYTSPTVCRLTCGKYGALWPQPTIATALTHQLVEVHPDNFFFELEYQQVDFNDFLEANKKIFIQNLRKECGGDCSLQTNTKVTIYITITNPDLTLNLYTNESYTLEILTRADFVSVKIYADNAFGARHALETLSQLVASYSTPERRVGLVMVAGARIHDKPVYVHRGLLLDSARNFVSLSSIKRQIDGMAASKMNVLHWHLTDTQSFPFESRSVPQMARYGAYSSDMTYSVEDVEEVVGYGKVRGVRVLLEVDAPAHAGSGWQWGVQEGLGKLAVCVDKQPWRKFCIQPPCGQLNPINPNVYVVLGNLYSELMQISKESDMFHMGGDEVFIPCWNSSLEIRDYLIAQGKSQLLTEDFLDLWSHFQKTVLKTFDERTGRDASIVLWSSKLTTPDVITKYLPKDRYIIQTWVPASDTLPSDLLNLGYRLIISTKDAWYLDHGFWGNTRYHDWRTAYDNLLPNDRGVLGGEACMWGEYVDGGGLDLKIWPRAAAAAERLWSNPTSNAGKAEIRFYRHRERLIARGIKADAVSPRWCYQNEGECV
uniref:Beta-hexosaminidase n=1 Tax=Lasioderma serricorne TaxID=295660 RepID=A0A6B9M1F3_9COLE|nr:beta-N-acetylglucosaminidase 2 [Lasioderma serricorne]